MPAGVLPGARRHTIPLTDQGAEGGRVPGVPLEGPIVAPRGQIFLLMLKAEIELGTTSEPERERKYPRFCDSKVTKYKDVGTLTRQIYGLQLKALLARYLNLSEDVIHRCCIRVWKSLELKVELMP